MHILKNGEQHSFKLSLLENQEWICPLCGKEIELNDSALDHDHESGFLREVLHDRCNRALGFIEWAIKNTGDKDLFIENVSSYLDRHSQDPSNVIHPRHFSLTGFKQTKEVKVSRFVMTEDEKKLYAQALADGPLPHPNPKRKTSREGSWKRTADKYGINHGRLLAYVLGGRPRSELETV